MHTLIIEDDATSMKLARMLLERGGHEVTEAKSVEEALTVIQAHLPDLIVLDLKLPGKNGLNLTRHLKLSPRTRHIPIVAVTAYPDTFDKADALQAGCDSYVVKPIDTRTFADQVSHPGAHPAGHPHSDR